jgi:hypothetical protein
MSLLHCGRRYALDLRDNRLGWTLDRSNLTGHRRR